MTETARASSEGTGTAAAAVTEAAFSGASAVTEADAAVTAAAAVREAAVRGATSTSDPVTAVRGSEEMKGRKTDGRDKEVLAVTSGFVLPPPFALMHCDMLQVFTKG